jgi:DNA-binding NtrC family response regulator
MSAEEWQDEPMSREILVIDHEEPRHRHLWSLLNEEGYGVSVARSVGEALSRLSSKHTSLLLICPQGQTTDELVAFRAARQIDPEISVILISTNSGIQSVVNAIKAGVVDYLEDPVEPQDLLRVVTRAWNEKKILLESRLLPHESVQSSSFCGIVAKSPKMRQIFELIERVAQTDSAVFITGETGVGKELVARAIHLSGPRKDRPFVAINCGALTETLLESELFGHEKGAFTGAVKMKPGKFECGHRGTLFLDEVGDVSPAMQVKLLRALQEKRVERVGGNTPIPVDVRVISATNHNIKEKLKGHEFRIDLFYRLNVIPIHVPPLKERIEDIPLLVQHFMEHLNSSLNRHIKGILPRAMKQLMDHSWPGNVRELENVIERAYITCDGEILDRFIFPHFGESVPTTEQAGAVNTDIPFSVARSMVIKRFEKAYITEALKKNRGNISRTAQNTGINPRTLWRKMNEYILDRRSFKKEDLS